MLTAELKELMVSGKFDTNFVDNARLKYDRISIEIKAFHKSTKAVDLRITIHKGDMPLTYYDRNGIQLGEALQVGDIEGTFGISID